jgi:HprK-related kinase B
MSGLKAVLKNYRPRYEVPLRFLDVSLTVKTNSSELAARLRDYYAGWGVMAGGGEPHLIHAVEGHALIDQEKLVDVRRRPGKKAKEAYYDTPDGKVILKKRTGVVIYLEGSERYVVGSVIENLNQLINQVNEVYIQDFVARGYILIHASAVADAGGAGPGFLLRIGDGEEHGSHRPA